MVKVIIQEQCPSCKNKFDSLIEFEHHQKTKTQDRDSDQSTKKFENTFGGSFTLGKLMQIISLMGGNTNKIGGQSVNLIIEQCKLMGLKKDDENIIYRILEMVGKHDVSIRDTLITIYRFAKVLGINDDVADMYYYKLMINPDLTNSATLDAENIKDLMWEGN